MEQQTLKKCRGCGNLVAHGVATCPKCRHRTHLGCKVCRKSYQAGEAGAPDKGSLYCRDCFDRYFAIAGRKRCRVCSIELGKTGLWTPDRLRTMTYQTSCPSCGVDNPFGVSRQCGVCEAPIVSDVQTAVVHGCPYTTMHDFCRTLTYGDSIREEQERRRDEIVGCVGSCALLGLIALGVVIKLAAWLSQWLDRLLNNAG